MYKFYGWDEFSKALEQARILNFDGMMGTGKTLGATAIAHHMLKQEKVRRAAFNFPCEFGAAPTSRWCFAVMDEAALVFDGRLSFKDKELTQLVSAMTFTLRKFGSYLVAPSFLVTDKRLRAGVRMRRTHNILNNRLWRYHWEIGPEQMEERKPGLNYFDGILWLLNPRHFYGVYDTYFVPIPQLSKAFGKAFLSEISAEVYDIVRRNPN